MKKQIGKFTRQASIAVTARILHLILGIGASIVIARVLGPRGKGVYSLAILLPSLLVTLGHVGISQASVFYVGREKHSPEKILRNNILFSFLLGILAILVGLSIILFFSSSLFPGVVKEYLFLALFLIPLQFFLRFVIGLLLGLQKIKEFNFINVLQSFVFFSLVLIFLFMLGFSVRAAVGARLMSSFMAAAVLFFLIKRIVGDFRLHFDKSYFKDAFKYGIKVHLGNIIGFLHYRIDVFLINIFLNPMAVGFYSISTALTEKIWLISKSVGKVLFPRVSSEKDKKRLKQFTPLVCRNILFVTALCAILLFFIGQWLITLFYSGNFLHSVLPFQILLLGTVAMSGWRIIASDLYGRGRPELNIYVSSLSLVLNIILNILWIRKYGIAGAAWATSASYTFAFIAIVIIYSRISRNSIAKIILVQKSDIVLYKSLISILVYSRR